MANQLRVKRCYEPPAPADGARFLVDRLWPRGMRKEAIQFAGWLREVAPSPTLRKWFGHDPRKWSEFRKRYFAELVTKGDAWKPIVEAAAKGNVTLLFSAHDLEHNNAVALREFLQCGVGTTGQDDCKRPQGAVSAPRRRRERESRK